MHILIIIHNHKIKINYEFSLFYYKISIKNHIKYSNKYLLFKNSQILLFKFSHLININNIINKIILLNIHILVILFNLFSIKIFIMMIILIIILYIGSLFIIFHLVLLRQKLLLWFIFLSFD